MSKSSDEFWLIFELYEEILLISYFLDNEKLNNIGIFYDISVVIKIRIM